MRAELGIGDLVRAWDALGRDADALGALVRVLRCVARAEPTTTVSPELEPSPSFRPPEPPSTPMGPTASRASRETDRRGNDRVTLEPLPTVAPPVPAWLSSNVLPRSTTEDKSPVPETLFVPERERAILAATARRMRAGGELDIPAIVGAVARLNLPRPLPQRKTLSLSGGVQLVVDRSPFMQPFFDDIDRLVRRFRDVAGDPLQVLQVRKSPSQVFAPGSASASTWTPPPKGTAVVVVSDLGRVARRQGRSEPAAAWWKLLEDMQAAGCEPIVLAPGRASSYAELEPLPCSTLLFGWDRTARVATATRFRKGRSR